MTKISVIGMGRVGLATGVGFAVHGHEVVCYDIDSEKVNAARTGRQPYLENELSKALRDVVKAGRLTAVNNPSRAMARCAFYFICVGTPQLEDGSMDSSFISSASRLIGETITGRNDLPVIVVKSTVVPGTTEDIVLPVLLKESGMTGDRFGLCANPEFLREGTALEDTLKPDRVVVGSNDKHSGDLLERLYSDFESPKWRCDIKTAEMVKYASNSFLATKVTFANEIANICGMYGLDSDKVMEGMALDSRINPRFLVPGAGFGGPCLPKDLKAIVSASKTLGYSPPLLQAVLSFNKQQAVRVVEMLQKELGALDGRRIALLGLAFKPGTDDVRDSQAIPIVHELLRRGAIVVIHDPAASLSDFEGRLKVEEAHSVRGALTGADGCIIQTSWREYQELSKDDIAAMRRPIIIDGRRTLEKRELPRGVVYRRIG